MIVPVPRVNPTVRQKSLHMSNGMATSVGGVKKVRAIEGAGEKADRLALEVEAMLEEGHQVS